MFYSGLDQTLVEHVVTAELRQPYNNISIAGTNQGTGFAGQDSLFSSVLLSELSHRVDIVVAIRQLCDSLDSNELLQSTWNNGNLANNGNNFSADDNTNRNLLSSPTKLSSSRGIGKGFLSSASMQQFISGEVSDICRGVVEPFCTRLLAFVSAGSCPWVLRFTMAALARVHSKFASSPQHSTRSNSSPIKPGYFLCNCIGQ